MLLHPEVELFIYSFALFKGLTGVHLTIKQRKADIAPWYRKKLRCTEGAVIVIMLTSVLTLLTILLKGFVEVAMTLVLVKVAFYLEVVNTVLLAIFMIHVIYSRVGYATTRGK